MPPLISAILRASRLRRDRRRRRGSSRRAPVRGSRGCGRAGACSLDECRRSTEFRFEDVPPSEYLISLQGTTRQTLASEMVIVVANQRTRVKLVIISSSVRLTVKFPRRYEKD